MPCVSIVIPVLNESAGIAAALASLPTMRASGALLAVVAAFMNARSRLSGIATGDQAIFVRREAFERIGGFPQIPLMEDIALSKALRRLSMPACLRERALTSGRRWERQGTL